MSSDQRARARHQRRARRTGRRDRRDVARVQLKALIRFTRPLQLLNTQLAEFDDAIAAAVADHPDAPIWHR